MRAFFIFVFVTMTLVSVATAQRARRRRDAGTPPVSTAGDQYRDRPRCMDVRAEPVFNGVGWNHVVTLRNGCDRAYTCRVSTNVDPAPEYPVTLEPGENRSIATRNGSPASGFTPNAICR